MKNYKVIATGLEPRPTQFVNENSNNHNVNLAKRLSVRLRTKWFWIRVQLQSLKLQISRLLRARSSLTFKHLYSVGSLWNVYVKKIILQIVFLFQRQGIFWHSLLESQDF